MAADRRRSRSCSLPAVPGARSRADGPGDGRRVDPAARLADGGMLGAIASGVPRRPDPRDAPATARDGGMGRDPGAVLLGLGVDRPGPDARPRHHVRAGELQELPRSGTRPSGFYWIQWGNTAASWSMVVITICAFRLTDWWPNKFLSIRFWVWTGGLLSYSLYLWHVPFRSSMRTVARDLSPAVWVALAVIVRSSRLPELQVRRDPGAQDQEPVLGGTRRHTRPPDGSGAVTRPNRHRHPPVRLEGPEARLRPVFDGMRGFGVSMVLVGHALFEYVESWVTIVDAFFVLSGFLIMTLLLQEARSTGGISMKKFSNRRRPAAAVGVAVRGRVAGPRSGRRPLGHRGPDLHRGAQGRRRGRHVHVPRVFPNGLFMIHPAQQDQRTMWHLWTLSVEEHFYLIIPAWCGCCIKRNWVKLLGWGMVRGCVAIGIAAAARVHRPGHDHGDAVGHLPDVPAAPRRARCGVSRWRS